jgi:hypothetical protein
MNPYETPIDDRPGEYDRSLMKRVFFTCLILAVFFAFLAAMYSWQFMLSGQRLGTYTAWEQIQMLFFDWRWRPDM